MAAFAAPPTAIQEAGFAKDAPSPLKEYHTVLHRLVGRPGARIGQY
jgi:hypothetical protein